MAHSRVALLVAVLVVLSVVLVFGDDPAPHQTDFLHQGTEMPDALRKKSVQARIRRIVRALQAPSDAADAHSQKASAAPSALGARTQANTEGGRCITAITVSRVNPSYTVDTYYYTILNGKPAHTGVDWDDLLMFIAWNRSHWVIIDGQSSPYRTLAVGKETTTAADASQVKTWMLPSGQGKSALVTKCAAVAKVNKKACTTQLNVNGFVESTELYYNGVYWYAGVLNGKSYYQAFRNESSTSFVYIYWLDSRTLTTWCINNYLGSRPCEALSAGITDVEPTTVTKWYSNFIGDGSLTLTCAKGTSAKCAKFKCGSGYELRENAQYLTCKGTKCTKDECCHATSCAKYVCPDGHQLRTDAAQTPCWASKCLPAECCVGKCSAMDCGSESPLENAPDFCGGYNCESDECCGSSESSWY